MKITNLLKIFATIFCALGSSSIFAQPYATSVSDITLTSVNGGTRGGVAYNPNDDIFYCGIAGNPTFTFQTYDGTGTMLSSIITNIDTRGIWWNPNLDQLEMNTFNGQGVYVKPLDAAGWATVANTVIQGPTNLQPNVQSCGHYDYVNDHFVYYDANAITRVSRATNTIVSTTPVTGLPATTIGQFSVGFFDKPGYELALYDYTNRRVYFLDGTTCAYTATTQLPMTATSQTMYNVGFAKNRIFIWNNANAWLGYPLFPDICFTTDTIDVKICAGTSYKIGRSTYTTPGTYVDTLPNRPCDSIVYTKLSFYPTYSTNLSDSFYIGNTYTYNGQTYTNPGNYRHKFTSQDGCDSTVNLFLKGVILDEYVLDTIICNTDYYEYGGKQYTQTGNYIDTFYFSNNHVVLKLKLTRKPALRLSLELLDKEWDKLCIGQSLDIKGLGADSFVWKLKDNNLVRAVFWGPVFSPDAYSTKTLFEVDGYDTLGCKATYAFEITGINCCDYFIPNAFTPNNDGLNDVFKVHGQQPKSFRMDIFDRWGQRIYTSEKVDEGWKGTNLNGIELQTDVYFYNITGQCYDGTKIEKKGDITLLR